MSRIKRAKAFLVAFDALVAALAGTAVGGVAVKSLSKKDKRQVRTICKKQAFAIQAGGQSCSTSRMTLAG